MGISAKIQLFRAVMIAKIWSALCKIGSALCEIGGVVYTKSGVHNGVHFKNRGCTFCTRVYILCKIGGSYPF